MNDTQRLEKVTKLAKNSVTMYKKYADAASVEEKPYYEGALEVATNIYDYILSLSNVSDNGTGS